MASRTVSRPVPLQVPVEPRPTSTTPLTVCFLPNEPGGLISTRAPGAAEVYARLSWRSPDDAPNETLMDELGCLTEDPESARCLLGVEEVAEGRIFRGRICAMTLGALGENVGKFLRAVNVHAARTDAVLETRVLRIADPVVPPSDAVGDLARLLARAVVPVRFGRVWTPLPSGASCGIGVGGMEEEIESLFRGYPLWTVDGGGDTSPSGGASG